MRILPSGDFKVKVSETITVTVLASDTTYLAGIGNLKSGQWEKVSPPNPEVRKFDMPNVPANAFDITFDFNPRSAPAKYHVTIVGDPAEDTHEEDIPPDPPLPTNRRYRFVL